MQGELFEGRHRPGQGALVPRAQPPTAGERTPGTVCGPIRLRLTPAAVTIAYGADSFLAREVAMAGADAAVVHLAAPVVDLAAFGAAALMVLDRDWGGDPSYAAARVGGQVRILLPEEMPDLRLQPVVFFSLLRGQGVCGGGAFVPDGFDVTRWEALQWGGQRHVLAHLGHHPFVARWPLRLS